MAPVKRKRLPPDEEERSASDIEEVPLSDDEIDISGQLLGKAVQAEEGEDVDDEDEDAFIKETISKFNIKSGTDVLKKTKGKGKITKGELGGGSFQSMGLNPSLLRSLTIRGYKTPTPIQRLTIPSLLADPPRDVVGMARTGSGKTLAYTIPLIQRLGGRHSTAFGARALILVPARELAVQVLKVGKELARGYNSGGGGAHAGDAEGMNDDDSKGQSLRWGLVVGGEGMDEQFEMITNNPDVIIATPGRLLHLVVEMNLDLRAIQYVVFDEADRLFEMGFATALNEIISRLPTNRQTLLFSATLPKTLVEFAKAGLQNPKLVRLDAESKISSDLRMAFFSVKQAEKDACLLLLLRDVIKVPLGSPTEKESGKEKIKRVKGNVDAAPHQTIVFVATKHHVEYLSNLLTAAGYATSFIYGTLDQAARTEQMDNFRRGLTTVLVVTDVAARGIDIPILENVVNYDFPPGSRVFIHRVGRTARAGRKGWAWSFVTSTELPHLLDLQLFLARPLQIHAESEATYIESLVFGTFIRDKVDEELEYIRTLHEGVSSLTTLREIMAKGQNMYERSQGKASQASYKRAKEITKGGRWIIDNGKELTIHPVFQLTNSSDGQSTDREALLKVINSFRPQETVFELGTRGSNEAASLMQSRRKTLNKAIGRTLVNPPSKQIEESESVERVQLEMADESDIEAAFETSKKKPRKNYKDEDYYMGYEQKDANTEKGYSLKDGASFVEQANQVTFDLTNDNGVIERQRRQSQLKWDRKKKKFIKGDGVGADNVKLVRTESGARLPISYRSGRFDEWKSIHHKSLPRVGDAEPDSAGKNTFNGGRKYRHNKMADPKQRDKYSDAPKKHQKEFNTADEDGESSKKGRKVGGRYGSKPIRAVKNELKTVEQIRRARDTKTKRKEKNARPSRNRKRGKR
ncbi:hypothetical protein Clacol_000448 [Clathrus columnatus]|uniref:RNA helicase n=1 Tax=Clathrus columnatus TaxID=1419009 RepID=A0AAV4ZWP4_9AGAM|nr:hypothetical protein Clacol_000448 [Clathrus columnatus]